MRKKLTESNKRVISTASWVLLVAFLTFYIVFQLNGDISPALVTSHATITSETVTRSFEGFILRDEVVLTAEGGGYCDYLVENGGYSGTEAELARVYPLGNAEIAARIAVIDERIALLEASSERLTTGGMGNLTFTLGEGYRDLLAALSVFDTSAALAAKQGMLEGLYALEQNTGSAAEIDARLEAANTELEALRSERASLVAGLGEGSVVKSQGTGNFFHSYDGLEEAFSSVGIAERDYYALSDMLGSDPVDYGSEGVRAIGTYQRTHEWFFAVPMEMNDSLLFTVGKSYRVSFTYTSGLTLDMRLERLVAEEDGRDAFLIFSCGSTPRGFDRTRVQTAEIELYTNSGYRVQKDAIRTENNVTGVYILAGGKVSWRRVEIISDNGLYCIVSPQSAEPSEHDPAFISLNDIYIISGSGLYEGKLIN